MTETDGYTPRILFVDDEPSILSALQREFRHSGYRLLTADSAAGALDLLTRESVDLVITDMRMPAMDGAELLQRVRRNWPRISRVLMTGHADLAQTIRAINEGGVHYYVGKPWEEAQLRQVTEDALERALLYRENERLLAVTQAQNARLTELAEKLEGRVRERTKSLETANARLEKSNKSLTGAYRSTIRVLSSVIEMNPGIEKGYAQQVADIAYAMGRIGELARRDLLYLYFAAQLHELGKVALTAEQARANVRDLDAEDRKAYQQYPLLGELALEGVDYLGDVARNIASHRENWDGRGFPRGLSAWDIPVGARIIRLARDYVTLLGQLPRVAPRSRPRHALVELRLGIGTEYDAEVLNWLEKFIERRQRDEGEEEEKSIIARQLMPGMVLSRDFYTSHGVLMLAKDHVLTERNIDHLVDLQRIEKDEVNVWVCT